MIKSRSVYPKAEAQANNRRSHLKYRNKPQIVDGVRFDSIKEAGRYGQLKILEKAGKIKDIQIHPAFPILPPFKDSEGVKHRGITYVADFVYFDLDENKTVVEDVKGFKTRVYTMKKKMFLSQLKKDWIFLEN